jgi:hypothetical protein
VMITKKEEIELLIIFLLVLLVGPTQNRITHNPTNTNLKIGFAQAQNRSGPPKNRIFKFKYQFFTLLGLYMRLNSVKLPQITLKISKIGLKLVKLEPFTLYIFFKL